MATLTAGVTWLAAAPSTADSCIGTEPALLSPKSLLTYCDQTTRLRVNDGGTGGSRMVTDETTKLAMAANAMARQAGLTGLAAAREVLGVADLGGMAATWGMPSLTTASPALFPAAPGPAGMQDLSTVAEVPVLPALPQVPTTPLQAKLPAEMSLGRPPAHNRIAGSEITSPADLEKPVKQVGAEVVDVLLPKAVESIEGTSMLPGGQSAVAGFSGLVQELGLR